MTYQSESPNVFMIAGANGAGKTTGSGRVHLRTLEKCKKAGHQIHIIYLYLSSAEMAVNRVANRVLQGGHHVPEIDIKRRYLKGLSLILKEYSVLSDEIQIIDNSHGLMNPVASKNSASKWKIFNVVVWNTIKEQVGYEH